MSRSAGLCGVHFKIRRKARMQGDSWGLSQHHRPLNEKNDQLSPALLKTHLHPVRFHYGHGPAPELQDRTEPVCTDHAGQALINLTQLTGPADSWFSRDKIFFFSSSAPPFLSSSHLCSVCQTAGEAAETQTLFSLWNSSAARMESLKH